MRFATQGVTVAVKKTAKKAAKKAPVKKSAAKKAPAKKAPAKTAVAKKAVAKRAPVKKAVAKKVAKPAPAKRIVKKSAVKKSTLKISIPPVPVNSARVVTKVEIPAAPIPAAPISAAPISAALFAAKPIAAPKQSTSSRTMWIVVIGILALAAIVWSNSSKSDGDKAPAPEPTVSESAEPTPSESASETPAVAVVEAPTKFVALKSADGLKLRWVAPTAIEGLTGYNVEIRANGVGEWTVIATVPAGQLTQDVTKTSGSGWTQFRVSSVYADGQTASATAFGIPGEFK